MKLVFTFLFAFIIGAENHNNESVVTIAVASNAQYAAKAIATAFEKETGTKVNLIVGSSGKLYAQIKEGAPYDIFLSADMEYPEALFKDGLLVSKPKIYAYGTLVLWTFKELENLNLNTLILPDVKTIAIANPKVAPYGEAAISVLTYYKLLKKTEPKLVYGESISQVSQYVVTRAADLGFVAKSVVVSPEMSGKGKWIELDKKSYKPIAQGAALLSKSKGNSKAEKFYTYLYSSGAKKIWMEYGYTCP